MRVPATAFATALAAAPNSGIVPRRLIYVKAYDRSTLAVTGYGYWTGDENLNFTVVDGQTGTAISRPYIGLGSSLIIPTIPRTSDLTIQTIECQFPQTHPTVKDMVFNKEVHFAKVDIHELILSTTTRLAVANPEIAFLGECDSDPVNTPAAGGSGSISLDIVSDAIRSLSRSNPALATYQSQLLRSSDPFAKHTNALALYKVNWGQNAS